MAGFADEINIIIHPVVLGSGKRYLACITESRDLKLIGAQLYETSGSMRLRYEVVK
ncbi:hypothetical protein D3C78_1394700 [compost metagenome]